MGAPRPAGSPSPGGHVHRVSGAYASQLAHLATTWLARCFQLAHRTEMGTPINEVGGRPSQLVHRSQVDRLSRSIVCWLLFQDRCGNRRCGISRL